MKLSSLVLAGALLLAAQGRASATASDLTLDEAVRVALETNEIPAIAAARLERAEALRRQAVAALLPSLTVTSTYTRRPREVTREINGDRVTVQAIDALSSQALAESTLFVNQPPSSCPGSDSKLQPAIRSG